MEVKWKQVLLNAENIHHLFTGFYCCPFCKEDAVKVMCNVLLTLLFHLDVFQHHSYVVFVISGGGSFID